MATPDTLPPYPETPNTFEQACEQLRSQQRDVLKKFFIFCRYCQHQWESYWQTGLECGSCGNLNDFSIKETADSEPKDLIDVWVKLGRLNTWICGAYDPPFGRESFAECKTIAELKEKFDQGNWTLGQAFFHDDLCFINQVNGGDEWLTIKQGTAFDSITMRAIIKDGRFEKLLERIKQATAEQCRALDY